MDKNVEAVFGGVGFELLVRDNFSRHSVGRTDEEVDEDGVREQNNLKRSFGMSLYEASQILTWYTRITNGAHKPGHFAPTAFSFIKFSVLSIMACQQGKQSISEDSSMHCERNQVPDSSERRRALNQTHGI